MDIGFSIIIPVHNAGKYLKECMDNIVGQTYRDIEIICVDDASEDDSLQILKEYALKDKRIKVVSEKVNVGTSKARKDGVRQSSGTYVIFVDADDVIDTQACRRLVEIIHKEPVDIIQFGVKVNGCNGLLKNEIEKMEKYVVPYLGRLDMEEVQEYCFHETRLSHNLWGKAFKGDLCRKAFSYISDKKFVMAEDLYAFFIITVFSSSYLGIPYVLYQYNYGVGITGGKRGVLEALETYCQQAGIVGCCHEFVRAFGETEQYQRVLEHIKSNLINTCTNFLIMNIEKIRKSDEASAMNIMSQYWDNDALCLMNVTLSRRCHWDKVLIQEKCWPFPYDKVKVDSNIIIYGAGDVGQDYYKQVQLSKYCRLIAWADRSYDRLSDNGYNICSPEVISNMDYDTVVIAIRDQYIRDSVISYLNHLGVPENNIV